MKHKINLNSVKKQNRLLVLSEIIQHDHLTRSEIARKLDLSNATVGTIVDEMIHLSIITEEKDFTSSIGRKPSLLSINKDASLIIIIDLATKDMRYSLLDLNLNILDSQHHIYKNAISYEENLRSFLSFIQSWLTKSQLEKIIGIGVSVPGTYHSDIDHVRCKILPDLTNIKLKAVISQYFSLQNIFIENDMRFLAIEDIQKVDDYKHKSIFFMCLGSGIGGALCVNGHIYKGANNFAGEIGQTLLTSNKTVEQAIAWDNYIQQLSNRYEHSIQEDLQDQVLNAYENHDKQVREMIDTLTSLIARPLANIIWLLNPDTIVINDQYGVFNQIFIDQIRFKLTEYVLPELIDQLEIKYIANKGKSVVLGAAHIIRRKWLEELASK